MSSEPTPAEGVDPTAPADVVELVGLAAYTELAEFGLLAARSVDAPDLATRQALADGADRALARQHALVDLVTTGPGRTPGALGAAVMGPFEGVLVDFEERTRTDSWTEGLLKGVVGHGVAQDFARLLAGGLAAPHGPAVRDVLERPAPDVVVGPDGGPDAEAISLLAGLAAAAGVLSSRLGLWGRRVLGEALNLVAALLESRPVLSDLATGAAGGDAGAAAEARAWLVSQLTAEHTRRMDRMGLAA